ncbi:MAG: FtsK/SpoIIIE domain-containing protein [Cetobacterium sp.]
MNYNVEYKYFLPLLLPIVLKFIVLHEFNKETQGIREVVKSMFNESIELLTRTSNEVYTFKILKNDFESINKRVLETALNSKILEMELMPKNRNCFYCHCGEINETSYAKLEKGSLDRLFTILELLKMNPKYISSQENETEIIHIFQTSFNPKRILRILVDIEHKLGIKKNTMNVNYDHGVISFSITKNIDKIYILDEILPKLNKPQRMELPLLVGMDNTGVAQIEDLTDLKHLLIAGKTGSGKSCTLKCIVETLMYWNQNIAWYMCDFAESALVRYENFNNVKYIESDFESFQKEFDVILKHQEVRMKLFRKKEVENIQEYNKVASSKLPYIILVIDEANGFKEEWDKKDFEIIEKKMKTLLKRGRKYGIFTIHAVQQTNDTDYVKSWKTQMSRVGHFLEDSVDASNLTKNREIAEKISKLGVGEFYLITKEDCKKMKGCLTNKRFNKLYEVLKEVYINDKVVKKIVESANESQEKSVSATELGNSKSEIH